MAGASPGRNDQEMAARLLKTKRHSPEGVRKRKARVFKARMSALRNGGTYR